MEGEAQVVAPGIFLGSPFGKKRDLPWKNSSFGHTHHQPAPPQQQQKLPGLPIPNSNWNSKAWEWDSVGFVARPSSGGASGALSLPTSEVTAASKGDEVPRGSVKGVEEDVENLTLKLGAGAEPAAVGRPSKRVRSGSPGSGNYPMCQVDDCRADLSSAKDYHRRHKVCEGHSKMSKAIVGKVMQRFCQQCSRFHPLPEFDEGKRSCRRRLAGHNRRRRKTQLEDVSSRSAVPGSQESGANGSMDIANLLAILARLQGQNGDKLAAVSSGQNADKLAAVSSLPDKDRLIQLISKIHPLPSVISSGRSPVSGGIDLNVSQASDQGFSEQPSKANGNTTPSTMDLLTVLSAALATSEPRNLTSPPLVSSDSSGDDKTRLTSVAAVSDVNSHNKSTQTRPSQGAGGSSYINHPLSGERSIQECSFRLPLQLFGSGGDDSPQKFGSSVKYVSSESSNPMEDRSPPSSPPVAQELFPVHSVTERRYERMLICREENQAAEASTSCRRWSTRMDLLKGSERRMENGILQNRQSQAGYASSSGSDHSPSSSNSDAQDRTGRIIFKLFDKDPSNLPASLRSQILNWLSSSPSEMESYIRPGCVVLSVYVSMPSFAWDELEEDLLQRVNSLVQFSDSDFWRNGRFLVCTSRQLASQRDGKIRLCKSWRTWSAPELTSVSPVAVVSGKETSIILRGRNLTVPGTKIHCTYMGSYTSKEVLGSTYPGTIYDNSSLESFNFPGDSSNVFGRCFIEVENDLKGNSFPIIIADVTICQELRGLESEFEEDMGTADVIAEDQVRDNGRRPRSREDVLHFLNELGWLFQKKGTPSSPTAMDFSNTRFKFLFTFSIERDWSALIKLLLDILVERSIRSDVLSQEALEMLVEVQLLSRAVKRKCGKMVNLLLHYSVSKGPNASKVYLFPPNLAGPGGLTPLHLVASTQESEDMVDALTNDPQEIGLHCWNSIKDGNGQSPHMYASIRNNHSYNRLVATKLADRKNSQISIAVGNRDLSLTPGIAGESDKHFAQLPQAGSCARCALMEARHGRPIVRTRGFLQRPYVHAMLTIAAVCVCVCLFFRGMPKVGTAVCFKWESLDFGPS